MIEICLALGSNLGNRVKNLILAIKEISNYGKVIKKSIIIENDAFDCNGNVDNSQNSYYNMVIWLEIEEKHSPNEFLQITQQIEKKIGRIEKNNYSARTIDIDIIFFGNLILDSEILTIPHKKYQDRSFVVIPLVLANPYFVCPKSKKNMLELSNNFLPYEEHYIKTLPHTTEIMAITNITPDSFSSNFESEFLSDNFIQSKITEINRNIDDGATIIDIGAESTRPNATILNCNEEINRLKIFFSALFKDDKFLKSRNSITISVDSYKSETVEFAIKEFDIDLINNVDYKQTKIFEIAQKYNKDIILMHSTAVPADKNLNINYKQADYLQIIDFFHKELEKFGNIGILNDKIILDLGIGFGTNPVQSVNILKNIDKIKESFDNKILLAISRKSMLNIITKEKFFDRDLETIGATLAIFDKFDYIRTHNVEFTKKSLVANLLLKN